MAQVSLIWGFILRRRPVVTLLDVGDYSSQTQIGHSIEVQVRLQTQLSCPTPSIPRPCPSRKLLLSPDPAQEAAAPLGAPEEKGPGVQHGSILRHDKKSDVSFCSH